MTLLFLVIGGIKPGPSVAFALGTESVLSVVVALMTKPNLSVVVDLMTEPNLSVLFLMWPESLFL